MICFYCLWSTAQSQLCRYQWNELCFYLHFDSVISKMDDSDKAGQDLPHGPGAGLAHDQVQVQEPGSALPKEDQNLKEDGQSACPTFDDVKFHERSCLQEPIDDDQNMPDQPNVETAADGKVLEVALDEPPARKENAMETDSQIGNEDNPSAPPISPEISLPSNAENQSATPVKWTDIEVCQLKTLDCVILDILIINE